MIFDKVNIKHLDKYNNYHLSMVHMKMFFLIKGLSFYAIRLLTENPLENTWLSILIWEMIFLRISFFVGLLLTFVLRVYEDCKEQLKKDKE